MSAARDRIGVRLLLPATNDVRWVGALPTARMVGHRQGVVEPMSLPTGEENQWAAGTRRRT